MSEVERHNRVLRPILDLIVRDGDEMVSESDAMVVLESVTTGIMKLYRPDPRHAGEFLDVMTVRVLDRMRGGQ